MLSLTALTFDSLSRLNPVKTVFLFRLGGVEDYGPHLTIGTSETKASILATALAKQIEDEMKDWTVVLIPSFPISVDSHTTNFNLNVRPYIVRDLLVDWSRKLSKLGFRYFICVSGNLTPRQLTSIEEAGKIVSRKRKLVFISVSSCNISRKVILKNLFFSNSEEHGGKKDTSIILSGPNPPHSNVVHTSLPEREIENTLFSRLTGKVSGYWGAPAQASPSEGKVMVNRAVENVLPHIKAVLLGKRPRSTFRSWYSILPYNKTFFRAWLVILLSFLLMMFFVWMSLDLIRI